MNLRKKVKTGAVKLYGMFVKCFCKPKKQIIFDSFSGRSYSDNPRAVSEKMHELFPDYRLVWAVQKPNRADFKAPDYVKVITGNSRQYFKELLCSFAYVTNEALPPETPKRKGQFFVQTWHGDRGFKRILYDAWDGGKRPNPVMDSKLTDLFSVGSDYAEKRIKTAFRYHGEVIKAGCPRNDCLLNPKDAEAVRKRIGIPDGKRVVLYAPTMRDHSKVVSGTVQIDKTLDSLDRRGGEWIFLVRAHPKSLKLKLETMDRAIDVSKYPDMSDLLMIADMLITDYSSCAGDFILKKKPVLLAQFDRDVYIKENRSFYTDIRQIGFLIAEDQDQLCRMIETTSDEAFEQNCEQIMRFYGTSESGHASEAVCRRIDEAYRKQH